MGNLAIKFLIKSSLSSSLADLEIVDDCREWDCVLIDGLVTLLLDKYMSLLKPVDWWYFEITKSVN